MFDVVFAGLNRRRVIHSKGIYKNTSICSWTINTGADKKGDEVFGSMIAAPLEKTFDLLTS